MKHSICLILLTGFVAEAAAKVLATNYTGDALGYKGQLDVEVLDEVVHGVDNLTSKFFDRGPRSSPLYHTDLDSTTLGKPDHIAVSARARPILRPSGGRGHFQKFTFGSSTSAQVSHVIRAIPRGSHQPRFGREVIPQGSHHSLKAATTRSKVALREVDGDVKERVPLHKQSTGLLPTGLSLGLFVWSIVQQAMSPADMRMTVGTGLSILVVSYLYSDYWLWLLHCFLDREENLKSRIPFVSASAQEFQQHHDFPKTVLYGNHIGFIDDLVTGVAGMGLLLGHWTSPAAKLFALGVILFGRLGGLNHFYCHAVTHGYEVPAFYKNGQNLGLLPTAKHHQMHHTAPHQENWNFLNGLQKAIYEPLYFASKSSYLGLFAMFYLCNPIVLQVWAVALGRLLL